MSDWFSIEAFEKFLAFLLWLVKTIHVKWTSFSLQDYLSRYSFEWRDQYWPVVLVLVFFWPIALSLVLAASTWVFWLLTSIVFGIVQLIYVTYQFVMIFGDIVCLSTLKSYSVIRNWLLFNVLGTKNRRRIWNQRVQQAKTYKEFLEIPVVEPDDKDKLGFQLLGEASFPRNGNSVDRKTSENQFRETVTRSNLTPRAGQAQIPRVSSTSKVDTHFQTGLSMRRNMLFNLKRIETWDDSEHSDWACPELGKTGDMLVTTTQRLRQARQEASRKDTNAEDASSFLKYLLSGVVKRNHLTLDDILVENARSVAEAGRYGLSETGRSIIRDYYEEVQNCLDWIADSPVFRTEVQDDNKPAPLEGLLRPSQDSGVAERRLEFKDRMTLIRKMKQNMGRTALMLSGGGAQAMYHAGTIRALIDSELYDSIKVISGTSGGSIIAAMCALKRPDELIKNVCVSTVSTNYELTGEMKKQNIRWFPKVMEMGAYWIQKGLLVDSADFKKCCDFYYGDTTFEEAFERTGKHVCITVSASRATGGTAQRLLLNHISTPHVTLSSAVAASCALPGVMAPAKLLIKDSNGNQEPFEVDGVDWIDGSVQADLPFQRISTLFNVSNYVVCQTNFHVVPFLNKAHHPNERSYYWRLFQTLEWDMRNRALKLSRLGLFPRFFGQDISKVFKQRYHGNLTLVPRFTAVQTLGLKALANPTVKDMEGYLKYGQLAAWPYLSVIRDMVRLERALDDSLTRLQERCRLLNGDNGDWHDDDLDSIASTGSMMPTSSHNRGRRFGPGREAERLKKKVMSLERDNFALKQQVKDLQRALVLKQSSSDDNSTSNDKVNGSKTLQLHEKDVWNVLRGHQRR